MSTRQALSHSETKRRCERPCGDTYTIPWRSSKTAYVPLLSFVDPTLPGGPGHQTSDTVFKAPIDIFLFNVVLDIMTSVHTYGSRFHRAFLVLKRVLLENS